MDISPPSIHVPMWKTCLCTVFNPPPQHFSYQAIYMGTYVEGRGSDQLFPWHDNFSNLQRMEIMQILCMRVAIFDRHGSCLIVSMALLVSRHSLWANSNSEIGATTSKVVGKTKTCASFFSFAGSAWFSSVRAHFFLVVELSSPHRGQIPEHRGLDCCWVTVSKHSFVFFFFTTPQRT